MKFSEAFNNKKNEEKNRYFLQPEQSHNCSQMTAIFCVGKWSINGIFYSLANGLLCFWVLFSLPFTCKFFEESFWSVEKTEKYFFWNFNLIQQLELSIIITFP
jgi:hypothetical protein